MGGFTNLALSNVLSHEVGHCLNLFHTHQGTAPGSTFGCAENPNGSNSATCGDLVTDTPADANISFTNPNCNNPFTYVRSGITYNSDPTNIMSYATPNCLTQFTNGQGARMRDALENLAVLQPIQNIYISGPSLVCGSSASYSLENIPSSITVTWNTNHPSVSINSSGLITNTSGISGPVIITATVTSTSCTKTAEKTIWLGTPYVEIMTPDVFCTNQVHSISAVNTLGEAYITGYNWTSSPNLYISGFGNIVTASTSTPGIHYAYITTTNACGTSPTQSLGIYAEYCMSKFEYKIYPNPAKTHVYIEFPENINASDLPDKLTLFSEFSLNQVKSIQLKDILIENKIKLDVGDLPKGIYYLHLTGGEKNHFEKFRLQID